MGCASLLNSYFKIKRFLTTLCQVVFRIFESLNFSHSEGTETQMFKGHYRVFVYDVFLLCLGSNLRPFTMGKFRILNQSKRSLSRWFRWFSDLLNSVRGEVKRGLYLSLSDTTSSRFIMILCVNNILTIYNGRDSFTLVQDTCMTRSINPKLTPLVERDHAKK